MDVSVHGGPTRRRHNRDSETESQKLKREKAAQRQRRKRERDRQNAAVTQQQQQQQQQAQAQAQVQAQAQALAAVQQHQLPPPPQAPPPIVVQAQQQAMQETPPPVVHEEHYAPDLSPEEEARREKVRASARERQRKHRATLKQRRMRDLGLDMGNEILPGMEEVHYRAAADGQYHPVIPPELHALAGGPHPDITSHEPPFPHGAPPGQTFASTLLLSFSVAPLLRTNLLKNLSMTNEELASVEPFIAEAWERWDHQRRIHYAEFAKNGGIPPPLPPPYAVDLNHDPHAAGTFANGPPPSDASSSSEAHAQAQAQAAAANDFRARFHRSIIAPTPFQTATSSTSSGSGTAAGDSVIDPHLANGGTGSPDASATSTTTTTTTKTEVH